MPVYMIQTAEGDAIKIGCAKNVRSRFFDMQSCSPYDMKLLAVIDGDTDMERSLQNRFADLHIRGEWFAFHSSMLEITEGNELPIDFFTPRKRGRKPGTKLIPRTKLKTHNFEGSRIIKAFLIEKMWSYADLAEKADCTRQAIGNIVKGRNAPSPTTLARLQGVHGLARLQAKHFTNGRAA